MDTFGPLIAKVTGTVEWADGTRTGYTIIPGADSNWLQDDGPDGADLTRYSFGDQLDKIAAVVRDYQSENTPTHHYHVGHNLATYMPDVEHISCHDDPDEARTALKADLDRVVDTLPDCVNPVDSAENESGLCELQGCVYCTEAAAIEKFTAEIDAASTTGEEAAVVHDVNDGRTLPIRYWIEYIPAADCEIEPAQ